jgi:hypothetical protein
MESSTGIGEHVRNNNDVEEIIVEDFEAPEPTRLNNTELHDLFLQHKRGHLRDGMKLCWRSMLAISGYQSMRRIRKLYEDWEDSHIVFDHRVVRRIENHKGTGKVFLDAQARKECLVEIGKLTMQVGGMKMAEFKRFLTPYVRATISRWLRPISANADLDRIFSESIWSTQYRALLPEHIQKGDKSLLRRLTKRNDICVWLTQYVMQYVACRGVDGKLYPHTADMRAILAATSCNFDAYCLLLEGGNFNREAGRTTIEAKNLTRKTKTGIKILKKNEGGLLLGAYSDEATTEWKKWLSILKNRIANGQDIDGEEFEFDSELILDVVNGASNDEMAYGSCSSASCNNLIYSAKFIYAPEHIQ